MSKHTRAEDYLEQRLDDKNAQIAELQGRVKYLEEQNKILKCALHNPDLPVEFIKDLLKSKSERNLAEPFILKEKNDG